MNAPTVRLVGARGSQSAFSTINRRWATGLAASLSIVDDDDETIADVAVHQDWQSRFGDGEFPPARRRVAVRPWDFGPYPPRWVEVIATSFDELWVHSHWTARCAAEAGVDHAAIRVVPLGVDPGVHRMDGPAATATAPPDHVVFLFAGAAVVRKGVDIALRAYLDAFGPDDPVHLVVKDRTGDVFYTDQTRRDEILAAAADPTSPAVTYIDGHLPAAELAALYRRADVLVAPYRAEGFALTVLEAMACGTVPLVPRFGACLDYCDDESALFVEPKRIVLPVGRELATNTLGFTEVVERVDFCEVPVDRLVATLRRAAGEGRDALRGRGVASADATRRWSWDRSVDHVASAVRELAG